MSEPTNDPRLQALMANGTLEVTPKESPRVDVFIPPEAFGGPLPGFGDLPERLRTMEARIIETIIEAIELGAASRSIEGDADTMRADYAALVELERKTRDERDAFAAALDEKNAEISKLADATQAHVDSMERAVEFMLGGRHEDAVQTLNAALDRTVKA